MTTPEQRREYKRRWRVKNPEYGRQWYERNKERVADNVRRWKRDNAEKVKQIQKQWLELNPEKRQAALKRYKEKQPKKKLRLPRSPEHRRIRVALSHRLYLALASQAIGKRCYGIKTKDVLGCSFEDFLIYIESKFKVGMTFENYGKVWHIDHIMPCVIFDLTKPEHRYRCFHFSNLQPMFAKENRVKHDKIVTNQYNLL